MLRFRAEIVKRNDTGRHTRNAGGNRNVAAVRNVMRAVHYISVHLRVKGLLDLSRRTAEVDRASTGSNAVDHKALRFEPCRNRLDILRRRTESRGELRWRQPLV